MLRALRHPGKLILQDERFAESEESYSGKQALVPILFGLSIPAVLVLVFAPEMLEIDNSPLIIGHLSLIMIVAGAIFLNMLLNPGLITTGIFDGRTRVIDVTRSGAFGNPHLKISFREVGDAYLEARFDDDGQRSLLPIVLLKNGTRLLLPEGTTNGQIENIRAMIGLR
jgi:hypothetical protein